MTKPEFIPFPKVGRLSRAMIVTEKIDGTNASVTITEDGQLLTASRTRWITPDDDNFGFSKWAFEHETELRGLGAGSHFGEWWGSGIQRAYGFKNGERFFSMFNVRRWCRYNEEPKQIPTSDPRVLKMQDKLPPCCGLVPIIHDGPFDTATIGILLSELGQRGSIAARGFMKPEGVVIYHLANGTLFKKTLEKDEEWKGKQ